MTFHHSAQAFVAERPHDFSQIEQVAAPVVSIIVPVKDEEQTVGLCVARVAAVLERAVGPAWEILFVDDGSRDGTFAALHALHRKERRVRCLSLSRNFGKEAALSAGLDYARGLAVIPFDVDLQDPPEVIPAMLESWRKGYEVVDGVRSVRHSDRLAKRLTAGLYYRLHNALSPQKIPNHVGDFRLLDRKVVDAIRQMPERNRFMKGLFAWGGFRRTAIAYSRVERTTGGSRFTWWRLWTLALDGITSSSTLPLRVWSYVGGTIALGALAYAAYIVVRTLAFGSTNSGYPSLIVSVMFLGGIQLLSLGVLGEYVGRILIETKQRPLYLVRDRLGIDDSCAEPSR